MKRREARVACMQILYNADFTNSSISDSAKAVSDGEIAPEVLDFLNMVEPNLAKIDEVIEKSLTNYSISRLNMVDKAIIRLATAELIDGKTPKNIIINEALEITKEYSDQGDHKATSFNNRLLDNICKNLA